MAVKQRNIIIRFVSALLPAVAGVLIVLGLFAGYLVYLVTHPKRMKEEVTPQQYTVLTGGLPWSEEHWTNQDGTKAVGWDNLVYGVLLVLFIIFLPKGILGSILEKLKLRKA